MDKHRIELFSDGVFAIVLTLMVLELKPPEDFGLAAFHLLAPAILVHALAFAQVGTLWVSHNRVFKHSVPRATIATLWYNLLAMFWATMVPFGARLAIERPAEPLGVSVQLFCAGAFYLTLYAMTRNDVDPETRQSDHVQAHRKRMKVAIAAVFVLFAGSLATWLTPLIGYIVIGANLVINIIVREGDLA